MLESSHLTVGQTAKLYGAPDWKVRRIVDSLGADIPRAGQYRLIPRELLGLIAIELQEQGYLASHAVLSPMVSLGVSK